MRYYIWVCGFCIIACEDYIPKPKALLRLEYPKKEYSMIENKTCPFYFEKNKFATLFRKDCNLKLRYPSMKATIYVNYQPIKDNLKLLLQDAQKLTYEHVVKADHISEKMYQDERHHIYGMLYHVDGNAASQTQFYITDSIRHFVLGSLYFYAEPNYDSIRPAVDYLNGDIRKIIESLRWNYNK